MMVSTNLHWKPICRIELVKTGKALKKFVSIDKLFYGCLEHSIHCLT